MQSTMNPISPVGRAVLPTMQGATPDQATARAAEVAKTGLIPFDQAISMKQMADSISSSGGMMNQGPPETVVGSLRRQIQEAMNPPAAPPAMNPPAAPPAMNAGVAALPVPDDMYAGVGMAGGGIVAFTEGGPTPGPYQPPRRIPYEESVFGKYLGVPVGRFFSGLAEDMGRQSYREAAARQNAFAQFFGGDLRPSTLPDSAPAPSAPAAEPAQPERKMRFNPFAPPPVEGLGRPFPAPLSAPRPAPPAPMGPTAPEGILSLIPKPDQGAIQKEVAESYGGLKDALKRQDDLLKERGAKLTDRADAQSKLLLAMTGFQMAAEASKPGATFLGSAGAAGSEYAKSRIAANEKFADSMDRLADSRAELDVAKAQLGVTQSDKAYERYTSAYERYSKDQDRVQQLQQAEQERRDRLAIYGSQVQQGKIASRIRGIDEAIFNLPEGDSRRQELEAQRDSLVGTYQTLGGSSDSSGLAIARIRMQAMKDLRSREDYKRLSEDIRGLEARLKSNPTPELITDLADARNRLLAMEQKAQAEALSFLSGGSMFGPVDLTGEGDVSAAALEAELPN